MKTLVLCLLLCQTLFAEKYPADLSYMVADLKYSQEHGVKICEIQHGILSTFVGDIFLHGENGTICPNIAKTLAEFPVQKWCISGQIAFPPLHKELYSSSDWKMEQTLSELLQDEEFVKQATRIPSDPHDISSYYGIIYTRPSSFSYDEFHDKYPSILTMDAPTHAYWKDKYLMSRLFRGKEELETIKPEWGLFPKKYSPDLTAQIKQEIPADAYVIKPRSAFLGHGVIIVTSDELDSTLSYILNRSQKLDNDKDPSYNYWPKDRYDSFLIEKYYPTDPIQVDGKTYEPTMRVAFIFIYNNQKVDFRFLGGYWLLPAKSLEEEAPINAKKKAYCKEPFFAKVREETLHEVKEQLEATLPILYQEMLR